jgi:hypothetical protein
MKVKGNILFKEEQYFRVKWLWWLIILCMLSCVGITLATALIEKEKTKEAWIALAIVIPLESIIAWMMFITKLETVLSTEGIFYKWWPFQRSFRFIPAKEIEEAELRSGPSLSYGSHWVPGYGRVHNVGPGKGFQFTLKKGKRIFIGTQKLTAFENAIDKIITVPKKI